MQVAWIVNRLARCQWNLLGSRCKSFCCRRLRICLPKELRWVEIEFTTIVEFYFVLYSLECYKLYICNDILKQKCIHIIYIYWGHSATSVSTPDSQIPFTYHAGIQCKAKKYFIARNQFCSLQATSTSKWASSKIENFFHY